MNIKEIEKKIEHYNMMLLNMDLMPAHRFFIEDKLEDLTIELKQVKNER